jgi:hypothetical protein
MMIASAPRCPTCHQPMPELFSQLLVCVACARNDPIVRRYRHRPPKSRPPLPAYPDTLDDDLDALWVAVTTLQQAMKREGLL